MNRRNLYFIIGAFVVVAAVLGYMVYQEEQKSGVEINVDESGVSIETN